MAESKDFVITRLLNAPLELVWKVYTEEKHMMQWWGPAGFKSAGAKNDFRQGGMFHYGQEGPDGSIMWGKLIYREIVVQKKLVFVVSFSDKDAGYTRHPMAPTWPLETLSVTTFEEIDGKTKVTVSWKAINCSEDEAVLFDNSHAGMNMGFEGTFTQLESYLKTIA